LTERVTSDGSLDSVLYISHVDLEPCRLLTVHHKVQIGLTCNLEDSEVSNPLYLTHNACDLCRLSFERMQIVAVDLGRKFALDAADRFLHVVLDRLREAPDHSGKFFRELVGHGGDQFFFVLTKYRTPLILGL